MTKLIRWSPFVDSFDEFADQVSNFLPSIDGKGNDFMPAIDMYEDDENIVVECQLVGIDLEKVKLSIENGNLCIKGEGEQKNEVEDKNYYRKEIRRGSFYRSIPLPAPVNEDDAKAKTDDGVLKISIPKKKESKAKTIKIDKK